MGITTGLIHTAYGYDELHEFQGEVDWIADTIRTKPEKPRHETLTRLIDELDELTADLATEVHEEANEPLTDEDIFMATAQVVIRASLLMDSCALRPIVKRDVMPSITHTLRDITDVLDIDTSSYHETRGDD